MSAVCHFGLRGQCAGGLIDREGNRLWVFDADATREALLQRELPDGPEDRPARRRRQEATAPGYTGRKRADLIMNRMVIQQSHTQEFLGSLPMPGNGHRGPMIHWAAQQVAVYADAHGIPRGRCVLRGDGEHGALTQVDQIAQTQEGFLVRCADYQLLDAPAVQAALAAGTTVAMTHADSGVTREVFDAPEVQWSSLKGGSRTVRLVITRAAFPADRKHRVGHRVGNDVFELFATDRPPSSLHAADVVALYLHRGQFEAALAQEERELPVSHWACDSLQGQRLWHLVGQWVWNLRIWLGSRTEAADAPCRRTDFTTDVQTLPALVSVNLVELRRAAAAAQTASIQPTPCDDSASDAATPSPQAEPSPAAAPAAPALAQPTPELLDEAAADPSTAPQEPSPATAPNAKASVLRFERDEQGAMHCPEGHLMLLREVRPRASGPRERHEVPRQFCAACARRAACRGEDEPKAHSVGRRIDIAVGVPFVEVTRGVNGSIRVSLRVVMPPEPPERGAQPSSLTGPAAGSSLLWLDTAAADARRSLREALESLRVDASSRVSPVAPAPLATPTRSRRAHRRRDRLDHLRRNAADGSVCWALRFHGLPPSLAEHLGIQVIQ